MAAQHGRGLYEEQRLAPGGRHARGHHHPPAIGRCDARSADLSAQDEQLLTEQGGFGEKLDTGAERVALARAPESRAHHLLDALIEAVADALWRITPDDILGWFVKCGYGIQRHGKRSKPRTSRRRAPSGSGGRLAGATFPDVVERQLATAANSSPSRIMRVCMVPTRIPHDVITYAVCHCRVLAGVNVAGGAARLMLSQPLAAMSPDPYRTPATSEPNFVEPEPFVWYDVAVVLGLAFLLGVLRVAFAFARAEPSSGEVDLAWVLVLLAPIVVWKEIAARYGR